MLKNLIDYYEVLEVSPNASDEVLKKAYHALVQKYHPDQYHSYYKKYGSERTRLLNEAYRVLSDPEQRRRYDAKLAQHTRITPSTPVKYDWERVIKAVVVVAIILVAFRFLLPRLAMMGGGSISNLLMVTGILLIVFLVIRQKLLRS